MPISLTNTLTRKLELLTTLEPSTVKMYVCGPTVYNFIHIGNARPLVFFDVVRRYLEFSGYKVNYVMNFTDVDDRIIERAQKENRPWKEIIDTYIGEYRRDMQLLQVKEPHEMPRVTEHIPQIIKLIEGLVANGSAYVVEGEVLFSVRNFKGYGKLSGKNIDDLQSGARVEIDEKKRDPLDFSLWKPQKRAEEPAWESPWGKGRPGWHIECSAMAMQYLGETFDIHGGGMDLMHPHHENEIAQSEGFTGKPYVRIWLHNNMLNINAEKMSKSVGNVFLCREFIEKYSAETLKFMLLSGHYRSTIDFSDQHIRDVETALHRFYSALKKCEELRSAPESSPNHTKEENKVAEFGSEFRAKWTAAMDEDLNTAKVVGLVFEYVRYVNAYLDQKTFKATSATQKICDDFIGQFKELASVFNVLGQKSETYLAEFKNRFLQAKDLQSSDIESLIADRVAARAGKDFKKADEIRAKLQSMGIELKDRPHATEWDVIL